MNNRTPADIIPQIEAMRQGVDYRFTIRCKAFELTVRPLSVWENNIILGKVAQRINEVPDYQRSGMFSNTVLAIETLVLASTSDVDTNDPRITDYVLQRLTNDELSYLFKQYVSGCDKVNPMLERIPVDELQLIVEALKKNTAELDSQLTELSILQVVNVCRSLILGE